MPKPSSPASPGGCSCSCGEQSVCRRRCWPGRDPQVCCCPGSCRSPAQHTQLQRGPRGARGRSSAWLCPIPASSAWHGAAGPWGRQEVPRRSPASASPSLPCLRGLGWLYKARPSTALGQPEEAEEKPWGAFSCLFVRGAKIFPAPNLYRLALKLKQPPGTKETKVGLGCVLFCFAVFCFLRRQPLPRRG